MMTVTRGDIAAIVSRRSGPDDDKGHVIVRWTIAVPALGRGCERSDDVIGGRAGSRSREVANRGAVAELLSGGVFQFRESVGHEEHGVAGGQVDDDIVVVGAEGAQWRGAACDFFDLVALRA